MNSKGKRVLELLLEQGTYEWMFINLNKSSKRVEIFIGPEKDRFVIVGSLRLFRAGVLGDCLGTFTDGVFCQFTRQQKPDRSLDFPRRDRWAFVVVGQSWSLRCDTLENVVDETVHNTHRLTGDSSVGMNLLQHFVDVDCVAFLPLPLLLLISLADVLLGLAGFFHCFTTDFWRHGETSKVFVIWKTQE